MSPILLLSILLISIVQAQVVFREPRLRPLFEPYLKLHADLTFDFARYSLSPQINNFNLLLEEHWIRERRRQFLKNAGKSEEVKMGWFQFGKAFPVDLSLADGTWTDLPDGVRVWRFAVHSRHALSLNLLFSEFQLNIDSEFYVSSIDETTGDVVDTLGPFTYENNKAHLHFAVAPLAGNTLLLELFVGPEGQDTLPLLRIESIVHGYKDTWMTTRKVSSGSCNINVVCKDGDEWAKEVRAVGMLMTGSGQGFCSGSMINNYRKDGRQLFLSAQHCGDSSSLYNMILFNHEAPTCDGRSPRSGVRQSAQGMKRLASNYDSDFVLFEVEETIPKEYNVYLAGWSAEVDGFKPENAVGIHHPAADIKKISFMQGQCTETCWGNRCGRSVPNHWRVDQWAKGTTEPGSSGSPLFDGQSKRIVGQLHGGSASCSNRLGYDVYGKLQTSFDLLAEEGRQLKVHLAGDSGLRAMDGMELSESSSRDEQTTVTW